MPVTVSCPGTGARGQYDMFGTTLIALIALPAASDGVTEKGSACKQPPTIPPLRRREDVGAMLRRRFNFTGNGVELGVQRGLFTRSVLEGWQQCNTYVQVDVWRSLDNYSDLANVKEREQRRRRRQAEAAGDKMVRMGTDEVALKDSSFDINHLYVSVCTVRVRYRYQCVSFLFRTVLQWRRSLSSSCAPALGLSHNVIFRTCGKERSWFPSTCCANHRMKV